MAETTAQPDAATAEEHPRIAAARRRQENTDFTEARTEELAPFTAVQLAMIADGTDPRVFHRTPKPPAPPVDVDTHRREKLAAMERQVETDAETEWIVMLTNSASPTEIRHAGQKYKVPTAEAQDLVKRRFAKFA